VAAAVSSGGGRAVPLTRERECEPVRLPAGDVLRADHAAFASGLDDVGFLPKPVGITPGIGTSAVCRVEVSDLLTSVHVAARHRTACVLRRFARRRARVWAFSEITLEERNDARTVARPHRVFKPAPAREATKLVDAVQPVDPLRASVDLSPLRNRPVELSM